MKHFHGTIFALSAALLAACLFACSDEDPFSTLKEAEDDAADEYADYYSSVQTYSSSLYEEESSSSSSSSSIAYLSDYIYLTEDKTLVFTLTYYKQRTSGWDVSGSSGDGDPEVSLTIYCISSVTGTTTTLSTGTLLNLTDTGEWSGSKTVTKAVPAYTDTLRFKPSVIDEDVLYDDDMSSGYTYGYSNIGRAVAYEVYEMSDEHATKYYLYWNWYMY